MNYRSFNELAERTKGPNYVSYDFLDIYITICRNFGHI